MQQASLLGTRTPTRSQQTAGTHSLSQSPVNVTRCSHHQPFPLRWGWEHWLVPHHPLHCRWTIQPPCAGTKGPGHPSSDKSTHPPTQPTPHLPHTTSLPPRPTPTLTWRWSWRRCTQLPALPPDGSQPLSSGEGNQVATLNQCTHRHTLASLTTPYTLSTQAYANTHLALELEALSDAPPSPALPPDGPPPRSSGEGICETVGPASGCLPDPGHLPPAEPPLAKMLRPTVPPTLLKGDGSEAVVSPPPLLETAPGDVRLRCVPLEVPPADVAPTEGLLDRLPCCAR